jgi:hypothetical protein
MRRREGAGKPSYSHFRPPASKGAAPTTLRVVPLPASRGRKGALVFILSHGAQWNWGGGPRKAWWRGHSARFRREWRRGALRIDFTAPDCDETRATRGCSSMVEQQPSKLNSCFFAAPHDISLS